MTQLPNDDQRLVEFLQQYRPVPPPCEINLEERLMAEIERESSPLIRQFYIPIGISLLAGVSILVGLGSYRFLNPVPNTAELELFLVNSWNDEVIDDESSLVSQTSTSESDWLFLTEPEKVSSFSEQ